MELMRFGRIKPFTPEDFLIPHFKQIADEMKLPYRPMSFTRDIYQMFRESKYVAIENAFRTHLTGDLYHEYSLG